MGWVMEHQDPPEEAVNENQRPSEEPRDPTAEDLNKIESIMVSLVKALESLILKSELLHDLDLEALNMDESLEYNLRKLFIKPRVDLAQKILRAFWNDELPVLGEFLKTRFPSVRPDEIEAWKKSNESSQQGNWPPPLPEIQDKGLETTVFMHASVFKLHCHVSKLEITQRNNERLEFLGDTILERVACDLLYNKFPADSEGQLTKKKTAMVRNAKLDEFATLYKLDQRLHAQLQESDWTAIRDHKHKIFADVFEAYVGAVYLDRGYDVCENWLRQLYQPLADKLYQTPKETFVKSETNSAAKTTLYKKIGSATRKITYRNLTERAPFIIECYIDDVFLGRGEGPSKKAAGNNAALDALSKTDLIEEQSSIRRSIPRTARVTGGWVSPEPEQEPEA